MGEMADWIIENGEMELIAHQQGDCDGWCPYCDEEETKKKKKPPQRKKTK